MQHFVTLLTRCLVFALSMSIWATPIATSSGAVAVYPENGQVEHAHAREIPDGIYLLGDNEDESLALVKRIDGQTARLGRRVTSTLGTAELFSQRNDNKRFSLHLNGVSGIDDEANSASLLIMAAGHAMFVTSRGTNQDSDLVQMSASIPDAQIARQIADALNWPLRLREHPGHQLRTTWTPTEETFRPGQAVNLLLKIENVGDTTVRFYEGGQQRGYRDNQFRFLARGGYGYGQSIPDTGDPRNMGGIAVLRELAPGEVFEKQIKLNEWFKFTEPDTYQITAMYELDFYGEDRSHVLWHDFVVGECSIQIRPGESAR